MTTAADVISCAAPVNWARETAARRRARLRPETDPQPEPQPEPPRIARCAERSVNSDSQNTDAAAVRQAQPVSPSPLAMEEIPAVAEAVDDPFAHLDPRNVPLGAYPVPTSTTTAQQQHQTSTAPLDAFAAVSVTTPASEAPTPQADQDVGPEFRAVEDRKSSPDAATAPPPNTALSGNSSGNAPQRWWRTVAPPQPPLRQHRLGGGATVRHLQPPIGRRQPQINVPQSNVPQLAHPTAPVAKQFASYMPDTARTYAPVHLPPANQPCSVADLPPAPVAAPPSVSTVTVATVVRPQKVVTQDEVMQEWKALHTAWATASHENRQKRERLEAKEQQQQQLQRQSGSSTAGAAGGTASGQPPMLFNPASMGMWLNLLMQDLVPPRSNPSGTPAAVTAELIRSPSGQPQRVTMITRTQAQPIPSSSSSLIAVPTSGPHLFDVGPRRPAAARMVFNDERLDSIAGGSVGSGHSRAGGGADPFASGSAASHWANLFRAVRASSARAPSAAGLRPSGMGSGMGSHNAAAAGDSIVQSLLHRTLYEQQPTAASLRNGGNTLIIMPAPPNTSDAENCTICLDDDRQQQWAQFPCCKNFAHVQCAKRWLQNRMTCPICRTLVP